MWLVVDDEWEYLKVKGRSLAKKHIIKLVPQTGRETLDFHFIRPVWNLDKSVNPK